MEELIKEEVKKTIKLGDKDYELSPLNLNVLVGLEEEFDCGLDKMGKIMEGKQASSLMKLIYILLKDNYPELTKAKIGELINLTNLEEITKQIGEALS